MPTLTPNVCRFAGGSLWGQQGSCVQVSTDPGGGRAPIIRGDWARSKPNGKLSPSHQSSASVDGHCPAAGPRFPESCCEELCPTAHQGASELVRSQGMAQVGSGTWERPQLTCIFVASPSRCVWEPRGTTFLRNFVSGMDGGGG